METDVSIYSQESTQCSKCIFFSFFSELPYDAYLLFSSGVLRVPAVIHHLKADKKSTMASRFASILVQPRRVLWIGSNAGGPIVLPVQVSVVCRRSSINWKLIRSQSTRVLWIGSNVGGPIVLPDQVRLFILLSLIVRRFVPFLVDRASICFFCCGLKVKGNVHNHLLRPGVASRRSCTLCVDQPGPDALIAAF